MKSNIQSALEIIANMQTVFGLERYEGRLDNLYNLGLLTPRELMRADAARIDRIIELENEALFA
jgi:hypothetical protein